MNEKRERIWPTYPLAYRYAGKEFTDEQYQMELERELRSLDNKVNGKFREGTVPFVMAAFTSTGPAPAGCGLNGPAQFIEWRFRLSDGELVDPEGNVVSHMDMGARNRMRWMYALGDRPDEVTMARWGVRWGQALPNDNPAKDLDTH